MAKEYFFRGMSRSCARNFNESMFKLIVVDGFSRVFFDEIEQYKKDYSFFAGAI